MMKKRLFAFLGIIGIAAHVIGASNADQRRARNASQALYSQATNSVARAYGMLEENPMVAIDELDEAVELIEELLAKHQGSGAAARVIGGRGFPEGKTLKSIKAELLELKKKHAADLIPDRMKAKWAEVESYATNLFFEATNMLARSKGLAKIDINQALAEGKEGLSLVEKMTDSYPSSEPSKLVLSGKPFVDGSNWEEIKIAVTMLEARQAIVKSPGRLAAAALSEVESEYTIDALNSLAQSAAKVGKADIVAALEIVLSSSQKEGAYFTLSEALARSGNAAGAKKAAENLSDEKAMYASLYLAEHHVRAGDKKRAVATAAQAVRQIQSVDGVRYVDVAGRIATVFMRAGERGLAGHMLVQARDAMNVATGEDAVYCHCALAESYARVKSKIDPTTILARGRKIAEGLEAGDKADALAALAESYAKLGDSKTARGLIEDLEIADQSGGRGAIAANLVEGRNVKEAVDELREALEGAATIESSSAEWVAAEIIENFARSASGGAEPRMYDGESPEDAAAFIADHVARTRGSQRATAIANAFEDLEKIAALTAVGKAIADKGDARSGALILIEAEKLARSQPEETRAFTLGAIARGLASAGQDTRASEFFAEAENIAKSYRDDLNSRAMASVARNLGATGRTTDAVELLYKAAVFVNDDQRDDLLLFLEPIAAGLVHLGVKEFDVDQQEFALKLLVEAEAAM